MSVQQQLYPCVSCAAIVCGAESVTCSDCLKKFRTKCLTCDAQVDREEAAHCSKCISIVQAMAVESNRQAFLEKHPKPWKRYRDVRDRIIDRNGGVLDLDEFLAYMAGLETAIGEQTKATVNHVSYMTYAGELVNGGLQLNFADYATKASSEFKEFVRRNNYTLDKIRVTLSVAEVYEPNHPYQKPTRLE